MQITAATAPDTPVVFAPSATTDPVARESKTPFSANPPHASTESTLAPTSEFVRYFLLAWPARYVFRGIFDGMFDKDASAGMQKRASALTDRFVPHTKGLEESNLTRSAAHTKTNGILLDTAYGVGSIALTASYGRLVYHDMLNIFSETVAFESGKSAKDVTFNDLRKSDNKIVAQTVSNFYWKTGGRLATDLLFFVRPLVSLVKWGDLVLGVKGFQLFAETWKRQPTLFEHLTTLVNNRINPKNGLGQPITVGDVFDLYQHYHIQYKSDKAFSNVIETNPAESQIWANGKVVFDRITELLNNTYAYKHASEIDGATGQPIIKANFALPKLMYLLGHDMIDPAKPEKTLLYIETANRYGINAVRDVQMQLQSGVSIGTLAQTYPKTMNIVQENPIPTPKPISAKTTLSDTESSPENAAHSLAHEGTIIYAARDLAVAH